jgi:hypothetical protein
MPKVCGLRLLHLLFEYLLIVDVHAIKTDVPLCTTVLLCFLDFSTANCLVSRGQADYGHQRYLGVVVMTASSDDDFEDSDTDYNQQVGLII